MLFLYTLLFIFAIVGFTEIISYLIFRIMSVKNECSTMLITPINSNSNYELTSLERHFLSIIFIKS